MTSADDVTVCKDPTSIAVCDGTLGKRSIVVYNYTGVKPTLVLCYSILFVGPPLPLLSPTPIQG